MVWNTFVKEFSEGRQSGERINLGLSFASFGQAKEDRSYMPVGRQFGFIFEQFDVASTIAHEVSHGAFSLHHTFSDESESYHAPQGTTPNLMDYTGGTTLNHLQWQWMHESHTNLLGFLDDESEGESILSITEKNLNDLLFAIREQNIKGEKQYELSGIALGQATFKESFKINNKTFKNISVSLAESSLYKIMDSSANISNRIEPFEVSKENVSNSGDVTGDFIKYTFHALKEKPEVPRSQQLSEYKLLELTIEEDDEWIFDVFLYNKKANVQITLTNIESDSLYTLSSYNVDNGALNGYILERPAGTSEQERTANTGMRIPEGTYSVCYPYNECNPESTRGKRRWCRCYCWGRSTYSELGNKLWY